MRIRKRFYFLIGADRVGFFFGKTRCASRLLSVLSLAIVMTVTVGLLTHSSALAKGGHGHQHWIGTWSASLQGPEAFIPGPPNLEFEDQTLRQIVRISAGGERIRVRLSNAFGNDPLEVGAVNVALSGGEASILPDSDRPLTFSGNASITIPAGARVLSDPVELEVPDLAELAVSIYLPESTGPTTWHTVANQTIYISPPGEYTSEIDMPVAETAISWFFLSGVEVMTSKKTGVIVVAGDSITDGANSTADANNRWPDQLAERLLAVPGNHKVGVLNAGIFGNRVLNNSGIFGANALARLDRDVLTQTGVTHVIFLEGINDIGFPVLAESIFGSTTPLTEVSAEEIIAGIQQVITRAHARGLKIIGGTLTPFEGAVYYTIEGEAKRQAVNEWIRTSGAFDRVVDFDAVLSDPIQPTRLLPDYDSGDAIHPNDAGYDAMAEAVELSIFERRFF